MKRRQFLTVSSGVIIWPLAASAQQQRAIPQVGVLVAESAPHPFTEAFRSGMRELGYVEGRTVRIEWRYADALFTRAVELATELVRLKVDVIAAHHTPAVKASMTVTSTIPIVMSPAGAPLQAGLVKSLAHPGGNVTGLSSMEAELGSKRLEILVSIIAGLKRVAVLGAKTDPFTRPYVEDFQNAAGTIGLQLQPVLIDGPSEFDSAFEEMRKSGAQAVVIQPLFQPHTKQIVELASKHHPRPHDPAVGAGAGGRDHPVISRRDFIEAVAGGFVAAPRGLWAQSAGRTYRIGWLTLGAEDADSTTARE